MKLFKHTLLVIAAVGMLTACNDDGYWEPYNTDVEYYSFPKNKVEISMSYSEQAPATYDVLVLRNEAGPEVTVPVTAAFSSADLTGPATVTFAEGSCEAYYTISINSTVPVGSVLSGSLKLDRVDSTYDPNSPYLDDEAEDPNGQHRVNQLPPTANLSFAFSITRVYTWEAAGLAEVESVAWVGSDEPSEVLIQKAVEYPGPGYLYRLYNCYYELGEDDDKGYSVEFYLNADGSADKLPTEQATGIIYSGYNIGWVYSTARGCTFENTGSHYEAVMKIGAYSGGQLAGFFGDEQLVWDWTEGYPFN